MKLATPRLRVGNNTICIGLADDLKAAHQHALDQAYELLTGQFGLSAFDAYAYASARVSMSLGGPAAPLVLATVPDL
jgi:acetamidase/formamidase